MHCLVASIRPFALSVNVSLYVMATGYDIDSASSGIFS